jgi:hypothetical protein
MLLRIPSPDCGEIPCPYFSAIGASNEKTVNQLAINEDVAVNYKLTSLSSGASETCTQNQSVKTHLEKLNQVFTGQTLGLASFLENVAQLCFTDTVLSAETLLLTQTNCVVRVSLALGAAVLTWCVGTLLQVLCCLRGQCDAESTRKTGLATGT